MQTVMGSTGRIRKSVGLHTLAEVQSNEGAPLEPTCSISTWLLVVGRVQTQQGLHDLLLPPAGK
jgi:hypothetical protein